MAAHKWSELREQVREDPERAERVERYRNELEFEVSLADLRRAHELTQAQLATALETTQSGISRIEHQTDIYLSTLQSYVEALGGHLELLARFEDRAFIIKSVEDLAQTDPLTHVVRLQAAERLKALELDPDHIGVHMGAGKRVLKKPAAAKTARKRSTTTTKTAKKSAVPKTRA